MADNQNRKGAQRCPKRSWRQHTHRTCFTIAEGHPLEHHGSLGHEFPTPGKPNLANCDEHMYGDSATDEYILFGQPSAILPDP